MFKEENLPKNWKILNFSDCIEKTTAPNKLKVPKKDYLDQGEYPIIDQGANFIIGYTNNAKKVFTGDLPVIIFGDHTRIFKYIDFPFSLGADGTKIIIPKKELFIVKYFYYFLKFIKIENHGYDRHYKYLKDKKIVLPPLETQKKIVEILEKAEKLKEWRVEADTLVNIYLESLFYEMFGDPFKNNMNWPVNDLGSICNVTKLAGYEYTKHIKYAESGDIIVIRGLNVKNCKLKLDEIKYIDNETSKILIRSKLFKDDVVMTYIGVNIGDVALIRESNKYHLAPNVAKITSLDKNVLNPFYLMRFLNLDQNKIQYKKFTTDTAKPALNMSKIRKLKIPLPSIKLQNQFAIIVQQIESLKIQQLQCKHEINNLFNVLMQKAFKGELLC